MDDRTLALCGWLDLTDGEREYRMAMAGRADRWVPACGGRETWTETQAGEFLYVYNPRTGKHGWLGRDDIVREECPY